MLGKPHYFGAQGAGLFGHLHLPEGGQRSDVAVLLCPPFGMEYMASHRCLRLWAEAMAKAGVACLRFDPPGCGDSADTLEGLRAWPKAIAQAIEHTKVVAQVKAVVLVGLRLGGSMACLAAQGRPDVEAVVALAPILAGRAFVRECKALAMATLARTGLMPPNRAGEIDCGGFVLGADDVAFLGEVDLMKLPEAPARRMLILDRDDIPVGTTWAEVLRGQGAEVAQRLIPGYHGLMQVPHFAQVPHQIIDHVVQWVRAGHGWLAQPAGGEPGLVDTLVLAEQGIRDQALWLMTGPSPLSVVVSSPLSGGGRGQPAVLMVNTGGEHRIGTNRMYTRWARTWSARRWTALRMDLGGLGDSPARPGCAHDIHLRHAAEDIRAGVAYLREQHGASEVHLVGLCSGAFHVLTAAFEGVDVQSVTAINQMVYFWQDKMPLVGEESAAVVVAITQGAGRALRDPARWLKLLRGQVRVRVILGALFRRIGLRTRQFWRHARRGLGWPLAHDLHAALVSTAQSGVRLHLVFSQGEPGLTLLREEAGGALASLSRTGQLQLSVLAQSDHTFTQSEAQQRLFDAVNQGIYGQRGLATTDVRIGPPSFSLTT